MSSLILSPGSEEEAYAQIEAAVMETARGRWFLAEFARRNRHAETTSVLSAIEKLQDTIANRPVTASVSLVSAPPVLSRSDERLQNEILDMARAISAMQREIQAISASGTTTTTHISSADDLDDVVHTTEQATTAILSAAERVQEFAWTLRENAGNAEDCDLLDQCATEIYTACGFQDLTAQRIVKVVEVLRFIDHRIKNLLVEHDLAEDFTADEAMIAEYTEPTPAKTDDVWMSEAHQAEIDDTFAFFEPAAEIAEPTIASADLGDIEEDAAILAEPAASTAAAVAKPVEAEDLDIVEPIQRAADPYAGMTTTEKLRAFR